jgi:hypothetical protein
VHKYLAAHFFCKSENNDLPTWAVFVQRKICRHDIFVPPGGGQLMTIIELSTAMKCENPTAFLARRSGKTRVVDGQQEKSITSNGTERLTT